jgi:membrane-bound lytic murein transglycosylase F
MQVMPETGRHFGLDITRSVENNVYAGVKYLRLLNTIFNDRVPNPDERVKFILASYNAGHGHILDAIRLAEKNGLDPGRWDDNVSIYLERKSDPVYYGDPVVRYGRLKEGVYVNAYVDDILERYEHYKNISKTIGSKGSSIRIELNNQLFRLRDRRRSAATDLDLRPSDLSPQRRFSLSGPAANPPPPAFTSKQDNRWTVILGYLPTTGLSMIFFVLQNVCSQELSQASPSHR